jgi:DNA-directed RNA polymerase subunit RPC12/RpoP
MPRIVCRNCGREIYTSAPIEQLFADERRCPRCGASLQDDRRDRERRLNPRRLNPQDDPGPPKDTERRIEERRKIRRRRGDTSPGDKDLGWTE